MAHKQKKFLIYFLISKLFQVVVGLYGYVAI